MSYGYDDYERYETCKIKTGYCDSCDINEECISHINSDIINKNPFIVKYLRNKKLKKLNDN